MLVRRFERGDTIIEVLFAITVFSLVAVGGLSLMNQGAAMAQQALEISLVRQQIDAQADALRYLNKAYVADYGKDGNASKRWDEIINKNKVEQAQPFDQIAGSSGCNLPSGTDDRPFALDVTKLNPESYPNPESVVIKPDLSGNVATYAQVRYEGTPKAEGIWIEAVRWPDGTTDSAADPKDNAQKRPGYYDFHIRACWFTPGQAVPATLGTIVRLYEPRG